MRYKSTNRTSCFNFVKNANFKLHDYVFIKVLGKDRFAEIVFLDDKIIRENIPILNIRNIRKASKKELEILRKVERRRKYAVGLFSKKALKHGLSLKLVDVKHHLVKNIYTFIIKSVGREVDLKGFLSDLISTLKAKVEIKSIGDRDETRRRGGLGICGRQLCCAAFLRGFEFVSIKMVKDQNLPMNPSRISGVCGKLLCCIRYEEEYYSKMSKAKIKLDPAVLLKGCREKDNLNKGNLPSFY